MGKSPTNTIESTTQITVGKPPILKMNSIQVKPQNVGNPQSIQLNKQRK